jgi:hypothetical protein
MLIVYIRLLNRVMSKLIVANGCSFTQELYLEPEHRWTTKCGISTNLAHGGGSNDRIFHTTIQHLNTNDDVDCLIIGWTEPSRTMLTTREGTRAIVNIGTAFDEETRQSREDMKNFYYLKMYNPFASLINTLTYMLHLQKYCRASRIKLLYWNAMLPDFDKDTLENICSNRHMEKIDRGHRESGLRDGVDQIMTLIGKLDRNIWIKDFWYGIQQHCRHLPTLDDGHPGKEASLHWANLVKEYL